MPTSPGQFFKPQTRLGYAERNFRVTLLWLFTLWNTSTFGRFRYVCCLATQKVVHSDLLFVVWHCSLEALSGIFTLTVNTAKYPYTEQDSPVTLFGM